MDIPISWWVPTDTEKQWLRRYSYSDQHKCGSGTSYCNAQVYWAERAFKRDKDGYRDSDESGRPPNDDPRWPTKCEKCDYQFTADDPFQLFTSEIYKCEATGQTATLRDVPIGAVWDAWWITERKKDGPTGVGWGIGDDHRALVCKLPGNHDWHIDSRASNCTMKEENTHHCWVRHGRPEDGTLHVDKNGHTCQAGGGSIAVPQYHGFLHHGKLTGV